MKKRPSKIAVFFKDELFEQNRSEARKWNKTILQAALLAAMFTFALMFVVSYVVEDYGGTVEMYMFAILSCEFVLLLSFLLPISTIFPLIYISHIFFIALSAYMTIYVWPTNSRVFILAELIFLSALILDKNWRILLIIVLSGVAYLLAIRPYIPAVNFATEVVNITCFCLLGCVAGTFTRISRIRNFENIKQLRISQERYWLAITHSGRVIFEYDVADKCTIMPEDVAAIYGLPQKVYNIPYEPSLLERISPETVESYVGFYEDILNGEKTGTAEFEGLTVDGWKWQRLTFSTIFSDNGKPDSAVISMVDITEQKEKERLQKIIIETDALTGIYNRATVVSKIQDKLSNDLQLPYVLFIADLDNLKHINDTMGHPQGDRAIQAIAKTLADCFGEKGIVGRLGGDEFIVYYDCVKYPENTSLVMKQLLQELSSFRVGKQDDYIISASIGVVQKDTAGYTFDQLYQLADDALYLAKKNGKNQCAFL